MLKVHNCRFSLIKLLQIASAEGLIPTPLKLPRVAAGLSQSRVDGNALRAVSQPQVSHKMTHGTQYQPNSNPVHHLKSAKHSRI